MSDDDHKSELLDTFTGMLNEIDKLPLHPENKILLYSRYALSKISWHLTEKLDSIASNFIRKWQELPI